MIPTTLPANGGDAATVNGHTVNANVPALGYYYATCDSPLTTNIKTVTCEGFEFKEGARITVCFTTGNGGNPPSTPVYVLKINEDAGRSIAYNDWDGEGIISGINSKKSEAFCSNQVWDFIFIKGRFIMQAPLRGYQMDDTLSNSSRNPVQNKIIKQAIDNKADKSLYGDTTINVGRKAGTTVGKYSTAEGYEITASGDTSHAEGNSTTASGTASHVEGYKTTASGDTSHAEGNSTTASGTASHTEGFGTTASGDTSHAEGNSTTASNFASHVSGHYNAAMTTGGTVSNTSGTAFVIGNGTASNALSNAFSVQFDGTVKAKSTITASTTADYAEFFEWLDGNPDDEDRVGYFVTLDGDKIRIATAADDYILGVVSGEPFVLGNGDCDTWNGMYLHDEVRRTIYEPAPKITEILDSEGNPTGEYKEVEGEFGGTRPKLNPEYDHT